MKKLSLSLTMVLAFALLHAQNQFTNTGNFQIFSGASVTFFGNFVNNGTFTDAGQAVSLGGTALQAVSGTSVTTFNNLVEDNAAGVTLSQNIAIANSLTLTTGALNLNSRTVTINNNASTAISRTSGYIVSEQVNNFSKIVWNIGANTTAHVFPFGTASGVYVPFTLQLTAGDIGNVTVSTYPTAANNTPFPVTPVAVSNVDRFGIDNSANVVDRFWQIDKDGPSGTANITLEAAPSEVGTISVLQGQRWNSPTTSWDTPAAGQTNTATSATIYGITSFSPWTLSGNNAPLPVEMLSFTAEAVEDEVKLNWKTATEINNDYFTIQRSKDAMDFADIDNVEAGNDSHTIQKYAYTDRHALPGKSYYRLKQTDIDGKHKFSEVRMVKLEEFQPALTAYPNPVTDGKVSLDFQYALESTTYITVYNLLGKIVMTDVITKGVTLHTLDLGNSSAGAYVVNAVNSQSSFQLKVLVK
jgi:hypothetical protein